MNLLLLFVLNIGMLFEIVEVLLCYTKKPFIGDFRISFLMCCLMLEVML